MTNDSKAPVSPIGTSRPELVISAAAINNEPIELDATPTSFEQVRMSRRSSKAVALEAFQSERGMTAADRERRQKLISERQDNPAVVVDVPQQPGADELERSGAGDETAAAATASSTATGGDSKGAN